MADRYYLMSKDTGEGPYLIGELTRLRKDEYQFKYSIKGTEFPRWFMRIPRMGDIGKTYGTQEVLYYILYRIVPEEGEWAADVLMEQNNMQSYNEWELLESLINQHLLHKVDTQPFCDSHQLFYFYPEIPKNANRFD